MKKAILQGRVVVITGAASGIGEAGARLVAREGGRVVIADIDGEGAHRVAAGITASGGDAIGVQYDATSSAATTALVDVAVDTYGRIDAAWANAGMAVPFLEIERHEEATLDRLLAVNVKGPWLLAKHCAGPLKESQGALLITASLSGIMARAKYSGYQASKGAAVQLTRSLALEFAPFEVRVNALCPGTVETPMVDDFIPAGSGVSLEDLRRPIPMGRFATVDDVAQSALFFLSDMSRFVTGVVMPIDGGRSL